MSCHSLLQTAIRQNGLRMTRQRTVVLEALHRFSTPATVAQIKRAVQRDDSTMEESTIYRTLQLFERFDLVASIEAKHGPRRWQHVGGEKAARLICAGCGCVASVGAPELEKALASVARASGFTMDPPATRLSGICPDCRRRAEK